MSWRDGAIERYDGVVGSAAASWWRLSNGEGHLWKRSPDTLASSRVCFAFCQHPWNPNRL
jgi:hypothetical protein